jgi:ubiquinone/menaquinone biosynthesis C-methylase UbiE
MNTIWSTYIQTRGMLDRSRSLRFNESTKELFKSKFGIENKNNLIEIGCGAGTLSNILNKWYPNLEILGIDRDTNFIEYAKKNYGNEKVRFIEDDATKLSFGDNIFDVTISHTVSEHINPELFFTEQYRVLRDDGVCLVLSSRAKHAIDIKINDMSQFEKDMFAKAEKYFKETNEKYPVCQFPLSEKELPEIMSKHGFKNISTDYLAINLTPDSNNTNKKLAKEIIDDKYQSSIEMINYLYDILPDIYSIFSKDELIQWKTEIENARKERIRKYDNNEKLWEVNVSIIMIVRGIK